MIEANFFPAIADNINEKRVVPIIDMRSSDTIFKNLISLNGVWQCTRNKRKVVFLRNSMKIGV